MTIDQTGVVAHGPRAVQRRKPAMTGRPDSDRLAAEFLRKELANGPVLVSELEASARAAGLLGSAQPITDAKLFKRAKSRSVYDRFTVDSDLRVDGSGCWRRNPPCGSSGMLETLRSARVLGFRHHAMRN